MKVVAYHVYPHEKAILALANNKKHDITLIANALSQETAFYAFGKEAVIVFTEQDVSAAVLAILVEANIKYLIIYSEKPCCADLPSHATKSIVWVNVLLETGPAGTFSLQASQQAAKQVIMFLDAWQLE
ncbi:lactate dehydrogenase [Rufibacter sp. LB8]|uniref:lactate dehydrogenase n=1 Tax=Rufibacter sp. LB8 TaxID=2777781 RepID=UPI00178C6997|nr:lactate dehydrogenase [Rufibacter sp. LB8]